MRIGLFSDTYLPEINGVASSVHTLRLELEKHGHDVYVITTKAGIGGCEWEGNVLRLSGIELKSLYGYVMTSPFHINAYNEIKALNLDLIHAHTEFGVGIFARICASNLGIPVVSTYHTTYEDYTHYVNFVNSKTVDSVAKKAVAKLSRLYTDSSIDVIAPSIKTKEMLLGYGVKSSIYVVPTGLDLQRFSQEKTTMEERKAIRASFGVKDNEILIVYVGRIAQEKSIDIVIDGFKVVKEANLPVKLLIVGGGPDEDSLKKQAASLGLDSTVFFAGKKPSAEVPHYYHASDAFVSASLTETQGMTYIEALASGLPVFARPDEVLDDIVKEGVTGFYFSSPEEFCKKVQEFVNLSTEDRQKFKSECIKYVEPYKSEVFYERVMEVYHNAINSYENMYTIDKVKAKDDYIQLFILSSSGEEIRLLTSIDTYYDRGLRKNGKLTLAQLETLQDEEESVKAYQSCIRKITVKDRTRKEIYDWLTQNTECDIETVNKIVDKLESKDYINDKKYCINQIEIMKNTLQGEEKIIRNLKKKGIPFEMIEENLHTNPETELSNAIRYAEKIKSSIHDKSLRMKKKLLGDKMVQQGFKRDLISDALQEVSFTKDEEDELDVCRKVAQKAKHRYEKKYSGSQLRNTVYRYCATQGFNTEEIYAVLDEMEWKDE